MIKEKNTGLWSIIKREIQRLGSTPLYMFCMLGAPTLCAVFFLTLMKEGLPTNLPVVVVDLDKTAVSRSLIRQLDAFGQTNIILNTSSFDEARIELQKGNAYGIYYIPEDFSKKATTGKQPTLSFYTNSSYLVAGSLLFRDMKIASVLANAAVGLRQETAKGYTDDQIMALLQPIVIETHPLGNPWLNYSVYLNNVLLPGILQLLIFLVTVLSIGSEIKFGTARRWLQMGNYSLTKCLIGKLLPQTVIFTIVAFMYCAVMFGLESFPLQSGWLPMLSAMFLLVVASQAVGVFMIGLAPTLRLGLCFCSLFGMVAFSICGFTYPVTEMHPTLQGLAHLFPLRHYFLIYVDQALNGRAIIYSWQPYVSLAAFLILPLLTGSNLKKALLYFKYYP